MTRIFLIAALLLCGQGVASAANSLPMLNAQRAYFGLYAMQPDARLQQEAQRRANEMARRGVMKHFPGRRAGRFEGVGSRSGRDEIGRRHFTCGQNSTRYRFAGVATAVAGNRTYYVTIYA